MMTLNRTLLTITIFILGTLAFLSFAPPQTGKWVYIWQANMIPIKEENWSRIAVDGNIAGLVYVYYIKPPEKFSGIWKHWNKFGETIALIDVKAEGSDEVVFSKFRGIDRRAEFGVVVE